MTGQTTYNEASEIPFPDVVNRYQALDNRDAMARAITTLQARGEWNDDRSLKPEDYPALTAAEHLELIALGEVMARHYRHPAQVHDAVLAGATWEQIAAATGGGADQARRAYGQWAEGQHRLRQDFPRGTLGLGDEEYAAAVEAWVMMTRRRRATDLAALSGRLVLRAGVGNGLELLAVVAFIYAACIFVAGWRQARRPDPGRKRVMQSLKPGLCRGQPQSWRRADLGPHPGPRGARGGPVLCNFPRPVHLPVRAQARGHGRADRGADRGHRR